MRRATRESRREARLGARTHGGDLKTVVVDDPMQVGAARGVRPADEAVASGNQPRAGSKTKRTDNLAAAAAGEVAPPGRAGQTRASEEIPPQGGVSPSLVKF